METLRGIQPASPEYMQLSYSLGKLIEWKHISTSPTLTIGGSFLLARKTN